MATISITALEKALLQRIVDSEFQNGVKDEQVVDNYVWTFSVINGSTQERRRDAGVAGSLVRKGLARFEVSGGKDDDDHCCITKEGWNALNGIIVQDAYLEGITNREARTTTIEPQRAPVPMSRMLGTSPKVVPEVVKRLQETLDDRADDATFEAAAVNFLRQYGHLVLDVLKANQA